MLPVNRTAVSARRRYMAAFCAALSICGFIGCFLFGSQTRSVAAQGKPVTAQLQNPDKACAKCHAAIYASYERTAMAGDSGLATDKLVAGSYTDPVSGVTFRISAANGGPVLQSTRESPSAPLADTERLAYFIGSGLHGWTYLFSRDLPEKTAKLWFEAPVNWYTQRASYGMAPAFDNAKYAPLTLPTDSTCLHCHATEVQQPLSNAINSFRDQPFLQGGVGCSACHGDPTAHLRSGGKVHMLRINELSPIRRDSVCLQCHLEGDAVEQKIGHTLSSFVPGDDLNDIAVYFVNTSSEKTAMRASSQYEAMLRSACRRAVGSSFTCTTCHDPHSDPAPAQRVAYFRAKCLQCHVDSASFHPATHFPEQQDCATCHMPSRPTSDISHEQNVDHNIEVHHAASDVADMQLHSLDAASRFTHAVTLEPIGNFTATDRELGLAYAQFAARGDRNSYMRAAELLNKVEAQGKADAAVHEQLAFLAQIRRDTKTAQKEYEATLALDRNNNVALANLGVIEAQQGETAQAIQHLSTAVENDPAQTPAVLDLALVQCRQGNTLQARELVKKAMAFNPDNPDGRKFLSTGSYAGVTCKLQ